MNCFPDSASRLCGGGLVVKLCLTLVTPWTVTHQPPLSMGFPRQEYWRELPFLSPEDLPNPGIESGSPVLQVDSLPRTHLWAMREAPLLGSTFFRSFCYSSASQVQIVYLSPFPPESEFTFPVTAFWGEGNGNPFQYSCLKNTMDGGAW